MSTTVFITKITFVVGQDSVAQLASPKRRVTASATKAEILSSCWCIVFSISIFEAECDRWMLYVERSSDTSLLGRPSNVSSPPTLGNSVATSSSTDSNE